MSELYKIYHNTNVSALTHDPRHDFRILIPDEFNNYINTFKAEISTLLASGNFNSSSPAVMKLQAQQDTYSRALKVLTSAFHNAARQPNGSDEFWYIGDLQALQIILPELHRFNWDGQSEISEIMQA